ncbi:MAG: DUF429 domain-containing protein [Candidatus Bathyarchaeia archaeon]
MKNEVIIGLDLAGKEKNATGFAIWRKAYVEAFQIYSNKEIVDTITWAQPIIVAIDAPLKLPKVGLLRKADKELLRRGYRIFPPSLTAMRTLTLRGMKLNKLIARKGFKTIEVHPTSTRKALKMPTKNWKTIQEIFKNMGVKGTIEERELTPHELDAITAALTAYLYIQHLTEAIGNTEEGVVIIPRSLNWREVKL